MNKQNVAIVGLGRVGATFLDEMLCLTEKGIKVAYGVERNDTAGKAQAAAAGVKMVTLDELIGLGDGVDVIFDLTGNPDVRRALREKLASSGNRHTVIAPETIARMMWSVISSEKELPVVAGRKAGY
jgi:threonine dehydrogenase-like Zn-dependent dehydrogenase